MSKVNAREAIEELRADRNRWRHEYRIEKQKNALQRSDLRAVQAERDRYRAALEEIAGHFVPYKRKTYGPVDITLDAIRREAEEALADE